MKKAVKISLIIFIVIITLIALSIGFFFMIIEPDIKIFGNSDVDFDRFTSYSQTVTITDVNGEPIDDALCAGNKSYVRIDDISNNTVNAFIAIEDKRFYSHKGVDYKRMASAVVSNIQSGSFREGASTITQQLIKNTHLSNEKTIKRKIAEIRLARKLERICDKNQILEHYFNILYFGSGIRGLGTASRVMFGKPASELTLAQSAALAAIINNPSKYDPYNNYDKLSERKKLVLDQMLSQGYISQSEYNGAITETLDFGKNKHNQFISGLLKEACKSLNCSEKQLFNNNYTLKTFYDPSLVDFARSAIKNYGDDFMIRVLILDNKTGGIVCDETNTVSYINPQRSPASTIKPFVSYAPSLENGMNPLSQFVDEPTVFGDYTPHNYNNVYRGYQSLKQGLVYSSNIGAVKLLQNVGIAKAKSTASAFGIPLTSNDDSLSIALGGLDKGITLTEIANSYRTLANGGIYSSVNYLSGVIDNNAINDITFKNSDTRRAVGDDTAFLLTDMLKECAKTGTAKKLGYSGGIIAAKTGTNGDKNGNTDCYCIAYTPNCTIAVWFGAKSADKPIDNNITGSKCCDIINELIKSGVIDTNKDFVQPQSVAYYEIDNTALNETHEVYLADPILPKRYRLRALLSKKHLPVRKTIDIIDYYDYLSWEDGEITDKYFKLFD